MKKIITNASIMLITIIQFQVFSQGEMPGGEGLEAGVAISIVPGNIVCVGTEVTFYASPVFGGPAPIYDFQWQINGINVGSNQQTFTSSTLQDGDMVWVIMTTNEPGMSPIYDTSAMITMGIIYNSIWTGTINTNWENPDNWSCGVIPTAQTNVFIPTTANLPVISSDSAICNDITIDPMASITINSNSILTINGTFTNNGDPFTGDGFVVFEGSTQNMSGSVTIHNMIVEAGSVTTISGSNQEISGVLLVQGTLNILDNLTLLSNANTTALIDGNSIGIINGKITQQRYIPASKNKGYKQFSSAFSNASIGQFGNFMNLVLGGVSNNPFPTLFKYSEANAIASFADGWIAAAAPGQTNVLIETGKGYTAQFGQANATPITTALYGNVNHGNISVPLTFLNPGNSKGNGWNLVGNPYPSPIDLDKLPFDAAYINKNVSIFISTSMYYGYYSYYNANTHIALNGGTRYLPSLHAFFVQCNNPSGGTLTFTNAMRYNSISPQLYKNEETTSYPIIKLSATLSNNNSVSDETVIIFSDKANLDFDPDYDVSKLWNNDPEIPNFYSINDNNRLAFNGLKNDFDKIIEIPLGIAVQTGGIYSIKLEELYNIDPAYPIILTDTKTNKSVDLKDKGEYIFSLEPATIEENRFKLIIGDWETSISNDIDNEIGFAVWQSGKTITVKVKGQQSKANLEMYDYTGRKILNSEIPCDGDYLYQPNVVSGAYFFKYLNGKTSIVQKIFIH